MKDKIKNIIKSSIDVKKTLFEKEIPNIERAISAIQKCIREGGKLLIFGNGGSAADSQHIAGELMGRFKKDRRPLPAIALTTNTSTITAIGNDYGYDLIFARQLEGIAKKGDIAIGISTSGNAKNVNEAISKAKEMELVTVGFTGSKSGELGKNAGLVLKVPSNDTPRIQEMHITVGHIICELVEEILC